MRDNLIKCYFKMGGFKIIFFIDIIYLYYGKGKIVYLLMIKDVYIN